MSRFKIGVPLDAFNLPPRSALPVVAALGVNGVQIDAAGDLAPDRLGDTGRREFRTLLRSHNLELAAVAVPLRRGLDASDHQQQRIEHVQKAMQLAVDLGTKVVVVPLPEVPTDPATPQAITLRESLLALARYGDRIGGVLAVEAGIDPGGKTREYLATFDTGGLAVAFDPANFLTNGHDPLGAAHDLAGRMIYAYARDAQTNMPRGRSAEVPLGAGDIEWMLTVATLEAVDYRGYLTVEREEVATRAADVTAGVKFLRRFVRPAG